jgi:benzoyl-CoA reductase/2-hydroxyglutaryl-CoA dehydratase subunit BcrC/BadD/HgdB
LIKSTYGYHLSGSNPFIEMASLLVAETTCDGKKKMYELMAERRPMYVLELPQKPDDDDAFRHWRRELEKFKSHLEERFETTITDERMADAVYAMNRERRLRRELASLMRQPDPPLTGRQLLELKTSISVMPEALEQYAATLRMLTSGHTRPGPRRPVRVLMTGVPMVHGAERVIDIVEDRGGLVVCMESCVGLKPILEDVEESTGAWIDALAHKYFHLPCSVMTRNDRRLELIRELARDYRADCVIELIWQACLTYDVESHRVRTLVENELNLPYLRIETDYFPSDSARIAVRVEALFETVRASNEKGPARTS